MSGRDHGSKGGGGTGGAAVPSGLTNSKRTVFKATYVPTKTTGEPKPTSRALAKLAFLRSLNIQPGEHAKLQQDSTLAHLTVDIPNGMSNPFGEQTKIPLLSLVDRLTSHGSAAAMKQLTPLLKHATPEQLMAVGRAVAAARSTTTSAVTTSQPSDTVASPTSAWRSNSLVLPSRGPLSALDTETLVQGFGDSFRVEPVGWLHLERLEMYPVGMEHGQLVSSVPMTPRETVNISHREWSVTSQTFENIVDDYFEGFSEQGVAEKTDIAEAVSNESRHSSSLDVNGSVSASYNGGAYSVTAAAGVDYQQHLDETKSQKNSIAHSMATTRSASARTRKDHKISFRLAAVAGTEDMAVRVLTNATDKAVRVDYYQLMRKWLVNLIRYGVRMTYDLVVPNPGGSLIDKVWELQSIQQTLDSTYQFTVKLSDVTPTGYQKLAQDFGVALDPPPGIPGDMTQSMPLQKTGDPWVFANLQFNIPDDYEINAARIWAAYYYDSPTESNTHHDRRTWFGVRGGAYKPEFPKDQETQQATYDSNDPTLDPNRQFSKTLEGKTGQVAVEYMWYHVDSGDVNVTMQLRPRQATIDAWQMKTWEALKKAGQDQFSAQAALLQTRKAELRAEIEAYDSLTLRRMEREEIMRRVLQWIFGPVLPIGPGTVENVLKTLTGDAVVPTGATAADDWKHVLEHGEFIKFMHNAIEWENVIFFAYPYFWDSLESWPFKRFLVHPDPEHRAFLRAGAARVVLTVRPGFELDFANLIENGTLSGTLDPNHLYVSIGDEIRNFAMTNYEGIPPANPDNNVRPLLFHQQKTTWSDMQTLILLIEQYKTAKGTYPPDLGALSSLTLPPNITSIPQKDAWRNAFVYAFPGANADYDLVSYGANGKPGGDGLDADITSWAEGSIIGQWFEYTPTNALDVAVSDGLKEFSGPA